MTPTASGLRAYLDEQGISVWAVAVRLRVNPGHLRRVLSGERRGSPALLRKAAKAAETIESPQKERSQDDNWRLIDAAMHSFFLKRGYFESVICQGVLPANTGSAWQRHYPPTPPPGGNQKPSEPAPGTSHEKKQNTRNRRRLPGGDDRDRQ